MQLSSILNWLLRHGNKIKVGAGAFSGGGIIFIVVALNTDVNKRVDKSIEIQRAYTREHVELKIEPIRVDIKNIKENQKSIKGTVDKIYSHLINKGK